MKQNGFQSSQLSSHTDVTRKGWLVATFFSWWAGKGAIGTVGWEWYAHQQT